VPALLRVVRDVAGQENAAILAVKYFRKALDVGLASVSAVAGWSGFGGELSDERVNALVLPVLDAYRESWAAGS